MHGRIKRLIPDKGFGFITADDGNQTEYFFHRSGVSIPSFDALFEGQQVEFDEQDSTKGPRAENVRGNIKK